MNYSAAYLNFNRIGEDKAGNLDQCIYHHYLDTEWRLSGLYQKASGCIAMA